MTNTIPTGRKCSFNYSVVLIYIYIYKFTFIFNMYRYCS